MSESFNLTENKKLDPELEPGKPVIPENVTVDSPVCKQHDLEKGINIQTELKARDKLSEKSNEDNQTSDSTSLTLTTPKNCNNQQLIPEQPKEFQLLDQNKTTKPKNQNASITSSQTHTFVIVKSPSKETESKNLIINTSPICSLKNNIPSSKDQKSLCNPVTESKAFHFGFLSKKNTAQRIIKTLKTKSLHFKNQNTNEKVTMWNSRNRILIDADGDDVAFLSGSGRNSV